MKKMKILLLLLLAVSLLCAACKDTACTSTCPTCSKCNDTACKTCTEKCSCTPQQQGQSQEKLLTLSGLTGDGYSFTAEGFTVSAAGKLQAKAGQEIRLKLVLGESYCTGTPVVKLDGQVLTPTGDTYTVKLSADGVLALEGACFYQVIAQNPFGIKADGTTDQVGGPLSQMSNVINAQWKAEGYGFANVELSPYYSVMFYVRAENGWISFRDRLGQFNDENTVIYGNGVLNGETGEMEPDGVWHTIEMRRQTDDDGTITYALYVDGQKHTHFDENTPVDARLLDKLNDFILDLNGTYYVSELFGCADPDYVTVYPDYYIAEQIPFEMEADGLLTEDYPCKESVRYNLCYRPQWGQEKPANFPLEPYSSVKFYINTPASGWIVGQVEDEEIQIFEPGSGWHEFRVESNGTGYSLYIDGEDTGKTLRSNLRELTFLLNDATYYISELFVVDDPNFDGVIDEPYYQEPAAPDLYGTGRLPAGTVLVMDNPFAVSGVQGGRPYSGFEISNKLDLNWNKYNFNNLDLAPYRSVVFGVNTKGWYGVMEGDQVLTEIQGSGTWRLIRLTRISGNLWKLYYGSTPIQNVTLPNDNLTDLNFRFGTDTYYVTELRAVQDPDYVPPQYVNVTNGDPLNLGATASEDQPDMYFVTGSYQLTPTQWSKGTFAAADVLAYKDLRFFVKAAGLADKWAAMTKGDSQLMAVNDALWHEVRLKKADGKMQVHVDGVLKTTVNDMSQLSVMFNENATYCYTDIYGLPDENYAPAIVKVQAQVGAAVKFRLHQADEDGILLVEKGTALYFEVEVAGGYEGTPVVKVNGEALTDVYGLYTYIVEGDATITVEGITRIPDGYEVISELPFDMTGSPVTGQVPDGFQTVTKLNIGWTADGVPFKTVDLKGYSKVKFAIQSVAWHGIALKGETLAQNSGNVWMEVRLERNDSNWDFYYGDELVKTLTLPNNKLSDLTFLTGGESTYYTSELRAIADPGYQVSYDFITDGLLGTGVSDSDIPENYDSSTKVNIGWSAEGRAFASQSLNPYTEVIFAVKSVAWHGIGQGSTTLAESNNQMWNEIRLVKNGENWDFYYGGELKSTITLPSNNLADLKLLTGGNDTYYVSELRGIPNSEFVDEFVYVAGGLLGTGTAADNTHKDYEESIKLNIGWTADGVTFADQSLTPYSKVKFVVQSVAWHGIGLGSTTLAESNNQMWNEILLVKNGENWDFYYSGVFKQTVTLPNHNLADLKLLTGGNNTYYISELRGLPAEETPEPPVVESDYVTVSDNFINTAPTSTVTANLPSADVTKANVFNCGWTSPGMVDGIAMAEYTELKFWYKVSDSGKWFELYNTVGTVYVGNKTDWTEIKLVWEETAWTLYVNGEWTKGSLTGTTLKDIAPTLTLGGSVTADVYVTELIGLPAEEASQPPTTESEYAVVADNFVNTAPTSTVTANLPSADVTKANVFNCGWTSPGMVDGIAMAEYTELKFWYKVSDSGKWFEMYGAGGSTLHVGNFTNWTEVKFVWEETAWTLYVDGEWTKGSLTGTTLKDIISTLTLGGSVTADVYVTPLIGKEA